MTMQAAYPITTKHLPVGVNDRARFYVTGCTAGTWVNACRRRHGPPTGPTCANRAGMPTDRELGLVASIVKSNGTTERTAQLDYVYAKIEFTTAR
jgi:hypothetical protein